MRTLASAAVVIAAPLVLICAAVPAPVEIPMTIRQGETVAVPFSVSSAGTHDFEVQFQIDAEQYFNILHKKLLDQIKGTVTIRCGEKIPA
jgi:hypothetical protein